jgi:predicted Zn-dependent protease
VALTLAGCAARQVAAGSTSVERTAAWYWNAGRSAAARGDTVRAEQYLSIAIERGFNQRDVLPLLLEVCVTGARLRAALNHAEPYLRDHPDDYFLRYLVANIELGLGETGTARAELERITREHPRHADAHYLLGVLALDASPESARADFQRYLELAPDGEHAGEARGRLAELSFRDQNGEATTNARAPTYPPASRQTAPRPVPGAARRTHAPVATNESGRAP